MRVVLLVPLVFPVVVYALPSASHRLDSSGSACLAIVLTLVCFLSVLFIIKRIYIRQRRTQAVHHGPAPCPSLQSSQRSSASFFYFSDEKPLKIDCTAFWVGLLGSPTWETSIRPSNKFGAPRYPFIHRIHPKPVSQSTLSSLSSKLSVTEFGARRSDTPRRSSTTTTETRTLSSTLQSSAVSHSNQLSTYPAEARATSSPKHRRLSLPEQRQSSDHHAQHRQRHSSLNGRSNIWSLEKRNRRSSWLRRVEPPSRLSDEPLPLSPKESTSAFLDLGSKLKPAFQLVLPPLPLSQTPLQSPVTGDTSEGMSFISHPYVLGSARKSTGDWEVLPPVPKRSIQETDLRLPTSPQPVVQYPFPASYAIQMPGSPKNAATLPRRKPKARSPSARSRKSPPVGPSPLRIMTLPERSTADLSALIDGSQPLGTVQIESEIFTPKSQAQESSGRRDMYSQLGIGYPSIWGIDKREVQIQVSTAIEDPEHSDANNNSQDPFISPPVSPTPSTADIMLDIIRELVEETSQWDASLYMDDGFKTLIQNSSSKLNLQVLGESQSSIPSDEKLQSPKSPRSSQSLVISVSKSSSGELDQLQGMFDLEMYRMPEEVVSPKDQIRVGSTFIHGQPLDILEEANEDGEDGNGGNEKKAESNQEK
ncbi:hypothetical protein D9758_001019 [Tetrapyrgos nigripes]|uniref:Uncharacterized protein n=1 Tax=Tetrapyrgos nigripes TaxID=182062 RepID=A0A8H5GRL4_9AGAR|nr:hypothetical protein D9758_001019 [Tetrapyrgos nigripes]